MGHHLPSIQCGPRTKQQLLQHKLDAPEVQVSNQLNDQYFWLQINFNYVQKELGAISGYKAEILPHEGFLQPITLVCHPQTQAQPSGLTFSQYHSAHPQNVRLDLSI